MAVSEATRNQFPFLVSILVDNTSWGTGILISPEWVLTTATLLVNADFARLTFGRHTITPYSGVSEPDAVEANVTAGDMQLHEKWRRYMPDNNLALIRVNPLALTAAIQPITSINRTENLVGQTVKSVGWGLYNQDNVYKHSDTPQVVDVTMVTMQRAISTLGRAYDQSAHIAVDTQGAAYQTPALITSGPNGVQLVGLFNEGVFGGLAVYSHFDYFSEWIMQFSGVWVD